MKHFFRGALVVLIITIALWLLWGKYSDFLTIGMRPPVGTQKLNTMEKDGVPDFQLTDLEGKSYSLTSFKDKIVILSFWASWCDPCIEEFPTLIKLVDFFQGRVILLAVSADRTKEDLISFLKPYGGIKSKSLANVVILWDKERKVAEEYGTEALPESYVLGKDLKIIRKVAGSEDWFSPAAIQMFHQILNEQQK
ncbi:MAG: TlpA family protein disulfide reductase [Bdellovibrionales bacterium]|nr:TlpA family protein disulfide reductase [Bdellovibrionales bacterium]